jgi:prevent-host-death family protein
MGKHSVVEAKNQLSDLIDRALKGEDVVITRHGQPVVELKPVQRTGKRISTQSLDWLAERRSKRQAAREDAGTFVSRLRDEEWSR